MQKVRLTVSAIAGRPFDGEAPVTGRSQLESSQRPLPGRARAARPSRSGVVGHRQEELVQIVLERDAKARAREAVRDRQAARAGWGRG